MFAFQDWGSTMTNSITLTNPVEFTYTIEGDRVHALKDGRNLAWLIEWDGTAYVSRGYILDSNGAQLGTPITLGNPQNSNGVYLQRKLVSYDDGDFATAWIRQVTDQNNQIQYNVEVTRYDATGTPQGPVATFTLPSTTNRIDYLAFEDGRGAIVANYANPDRNGLYEVAIQYVAADGTLEGQRVIITPNDSYNHYAYSAAVNQDGHIFVPYYSSTNGYLEYAYTVVDETGAVIRAHSTYLIDQSLPISDVVALSNGNFVTLSTGGATTVHAQFFDGNGAPLDGAFQIQGEEDPSTIGWLYGGQEDMGQARIIADANGGFIVAWSVMLNNGYGENGPSGTGYGVTGIFEIHAQRFSATGAKLGNEIILAADTLNVTPNISTQGDGKLTILVQQWTDESSPSWPYRQYETVAKTIALDDPESFGTGGAYADTLLGSAGNDTMNGLAGDDYIRSRSGDDVLHGGDGADKLVAEAGNDQLYGGSGNDKLWGGTGDDMIFGEDGNDNLIGGDGNDLLRGGLGDDVISDSYGNNLLFGDAGNDVLYGWGEETYMEGGAGADTIVSTYYNHLAHAVYWSSDEGVTVVLNDYSYQAYAAGGHAQGDILYYIQNVDGSEFNDILGGNYYDNWLNGYGGDDVINGAGGSDHLFGGAGNDLIEGGSGINVVNGGAGADAFVFNVQDAATRTYVADFEIGLDELRFAEGLFANSQQVLDSAYQEGTSTVIETWTGQLVVLTNTQLSNLTTQDILIF
jgi:Ca2+-binding RTX toxin-like protein